MDLFTIKQWVFLLICAFGLLSFFVCKVWLRQKTLMDDNVALGKMVEGVPAKVAELLK